MSGVQLNERLMKAITKAKHLNEITESGDFKKGQVDSLMPDTNVEPKNVDQIDPNKISTQGRQRFKPQESENNVGGSTARQKYQEYSSQLQSEQVQENLKNSKLPDHIKQSLQKRLPKTQSDYSRGNSSVLNEESVNKIKNMMGEKTQQTNTPPQPQQPTNQDQQPQQLNELASYGLTAMIKEAVEKVLEEKKDDFIQLDSGESNMLYIKLDTTIYKCKIVGTKESKK